MTGFSDEDRWILLRQILMSPMFTSDRQRIGAVEAVVASRSPLAKPKLERRVAPRDFERGPHSTDAPELRVRKRRAQQRRQVRERLQMATALLGHVMSEE